MNYKILIISILTCLYWFSANAQDKKSFRIVETKVDSIYPGITATIELTANIIPIKSDFKITDENQKPLEILELNRRGSDANTQSTRLVYFLVDASNYTEGTYIQSFKTALKESLNQLDDNDFINVGYFGYDDSGNVNQINSDFDNNFRFVESEIQNRITASLDSGSTTDIMKAVYEAMDKINETQKDGQKVLILISGAIYNNNTTYKSDVIVERALKLGITIHTINYRINTLFAPDAFRLVSNRTDGMSATSATSTDIKNAIGDCLEKRPTANTSDNAAMPQYEIKFTLLSDAPRDGLTHKYRIAYNQTEQIGEFTAPNADGTSSNFWSSYGLIVFIIAGLLVGLGYWQYNEMRLRKLEEEEAQAEMEAQREADLRRKEQEKQSLLQDMQEKNIRLQEQLRLKEQELAKKIDQVPTVIPASKIDPKNTIIGGGGSAPVFQVVAGAFSKNYRLNKPTMAIGRAANNDIVIPEQTVSSHHASITIENGSFFLNDLGSTNGTFVNGTRIDKKLLKSGDIIKMGAANCRFEIS